MRGRARAVIVVMDGVGAGPAPDSRQYGDAEANTLGHVLERAARRGGCALPVLQGLGLGNLASLPGVAPNPQPRASFGLMRELSAGKDTITGHWEMMGILNTAPFPTFPSGFPPDLILRFESAIGRKVLGNKAASGTAIMEELGERHIKSGSPIVYTSADSVFQIAAHTAVIGVDELYGMCREARRLLQGPGQNVCRVIARPFEGPPGGFRRLTAKRKDFSVPPLGETVADRLQAAGVPVFSVGKVAEMFDMRGFPSGTVKTANNRQGMEEITRLLKTADRGLVFANLNDFDTLYGHRNDPLGFACALEEFDALLGESLLPALGPGDYLFISADHGNDPTTPGTDHSRELVPLLFLESQRPGRDLGTRQGFMDLGATAASILGVQAPAGKSFF